MFNPKYVEVLALFPGCTEEEELIPCSTLVDVAKKDYGQPLSGSDHSSDL